MCAALSFSLSLSLCLYMCVSDRIGVWTVYIVLMLTPCDGLCARVCSASVGVSRSISHKPTTTHAPLSTSMSPPKLMYRKRSSSMPRSTLTRPTFTSPRSLPLYAQPGALGDGKYDRRVVLVLLLVGGVFCVTPLHFSSAPDVFPLSLATHLPPLVAATPQPVAGTPTRDVEMTGLVTDTPPSSLGAAAPFTEPGTRGEQPVRRLFDAPRSER
jgi:hypothetical protein